MASKVLQRLARTAVLTGVAGLLVASAASARPRPGARPNPATRPRGFSLFAGAVNVLMNVNRVQCAVNNRGLACIDPNGSPTIPGGFWPKGTPNQYIFGSGIQVAGVVMGTKAENPWAGDTVGVFFEDATGLYPQSEGLTTTFNSLSSDDLANWPSAAYANDTSLYHESLIGRKAISQQDTWSRSWDGNPQQSGGRKHSMGILTDSRGLMWNFPTGNQDIVYFIFRFINITSGVRASYDNLANYGYSPSDINDIFAIAQDFRAKAQAAYNVALPDTGWTFDRTYAAVTMDADVSADAQQDYASAFLNFNLAFSYRRDFTCPECQFFPDINGPPFINSIGLVGSKILKSPQDLGIAIFNVPTNGGSIGDPRNSQQLWRYLSGNFSAQDGQCSVPSAQVILRHFCYIEQNYQDTRFMESSGPFRLNPGHSEVFVAAYVHAAPLGSAPAVTPPFGPPIPAMAIDVGGDTKPVFPISGTRLVQQLDTVKTIDRIAGWITHANPNGDSTVSQDEVTTQPRSLLNKAMVAQAVFDNRFLLPFAPEPAPFFLIPGDNRVTVVWSKTSTETDGDPFFNVASNVASPLYDPDFRKFDVEGYRVWRGRTQSSLEVIAAYDYSGTSILDYNGQFYNGDYGLQCAPELGVTVSCPAFPNPISLVGNIIQVPPGGRVQLGITDTVIITIDSLGDTTRTTRRGDGTILNTLADTALTGGGNPSGLPPLRDTGVPFSFVDSTVLNGVPYFYAVTAFDVNSVKSGPSSLESPQVSKRVTPRAASGQETSGLLIAMKLVGQNGDTLDPSAPEPTINAATGIFSGPFPPTNVLNAGFAAFIPQILASSGSISITIDSVVPTGQADGGYVGTLGPVVYWFTGQGAGAPVKFSVAMQTEGFTTVRSGSGGFQATTSDSTQASRFGGDGSYALFGNVAFQAPGAYRLALKGRADANGDPVGPNNGARWWAGAANENTNDPNGQQCFQQNGSFTCALADLSRNAGAIAGVDIFGIHAYNTVATSSPTRDMEALVSEVMRAADFKWYWGANGAVDSVVDVTHHVKVPYSPAVRASWGILNDSSFTNTPPAAAFDGNNAKLTWADLFCVAPLGAVLNRCGGAAGTPAFLMNHALLEPVAFASSTTAGTSGLAVNGTGFMIYLNGNWFLMRMAALPAANTVWNVRMYTGNVTGTVGSYGYLGSERPAPVPGLKMVVGYEGTSMNVAVTADSLLSRIHTVPDPYYVTNSLEISGNNKILRFVNVPSQAIIRIYSASGILVNIVTHNDPTGGGDATWNLRNRNNQFVASGVYFYHVETPDGRSKVGRFTVVNFAQ